MGAPTHRGWSRDPVVWALVAIACGTSAGVFFAGRYLPYDDWAGHVGLSAVLAHGDETGADRYLTRSLAPSPYMLFYLCTAAWAQVVDVEVGAKLNLVLASGLLVVGSARLAAATGRDPRLAGLAPLGLYGASLGMGFASFVFASPAVLFVLADLEATLARPRRGAAARLAVGLLWCFLGHGLLFLLAGGLAAVRGLAHLARHRRAALPRVRAVSLAFAPVLLVALPSVLRRLEHPYVSPEFARGDGPALATFTTLEQHLATLPGDLLDRGGDGHAVTALLAGAVLLAWLIASRFRRRDARSSGLLVYLAATAALFACGPVTLGWPVTFWIVYQRMGSFVLLLAFLLPKVDLRGRLGSALALVAAVPVLHNAAVDAERVRAFSAWAAPFDAVRAAIPPGQRVLPLLPAGAPGFGREAGTLGFLLLADSAAYVPIGHLPEETPVHRTNHPETPYNFSIRSYRPEAAAEQYDYVVTRGRALAEKTRASGRFAPVTEVDDWAVFRRARDTRPDGLPE